MDWRNYEILVSLKDCSGSCLKCIAKMLLMVHFYMIADQN